MRLRPPSSGDLDAVLAVIVARDVADLGAPDFSREDLEADWAAEGWEGRVAEDETGRVVGYAEVRGRHALGAVHPDAEGRGVGAALLGWIEDRPGVRRQQAAEANARARELLEAHGWTRRWSYGRMAVGLDPAVRPADFRGLRTGDAPRLHTISEAAFSPVADHHPASLAEFIAEHLAAHDLDPGLSRVAADGFALVRRWAEEETGFVDLLAVHPEAAGRGLGTALLRAVFAACAAAGLRRCELGVGGFNLRAVALYERVGMGRRFRIDSYERVG